MSTFNIIFNSILQGFIYFFSFLNNMFYYRDENNEIQMLWLDGRKIIYD